MENNDYKKILLPDNMAFDFMPSNARVYDLNPDEIPTLHSDDEAMMQEVVFYLNLNIIRCCSG